MNQTAPVWNNGHGDAAKSAAAILPVPDFRPSKLSFIEPHEVTEAQDFINGEWLKASKGKPLSFRVAGYKLLVKIHIRPEEMKTGIDAEGKPYTIYAPDSVRAEDKFHSCAGLVVAMGEQAYTGTLRDGSPRYPNGPWARCGDFVVFDRYAGKRLTINGVACMVINDDAIDGVVADPSDIEAGHSEHRI